MRLSINKARCQGCLVCELACSFHHTKAFSLEHASIKIYFDDRYGINIDLLPSCDFCENEEEPLCIEFCPTDAIFTER